MRWNSSIAILRRASGLAAKGLEQAAKFSWRKTAEETAAIYRETAQSQKR